MSRLLNFVLTRFYDVKDFYRSRVWNVNGEEWKLKTVDLQSLILCTAYTVGNTHGGLH